MEILDLVLKLINELELNNYLYNFKIDNNMEALGSYNRYKKILKINLKKIKEEYENSDFGIKFILFHEIAHIEQLKQINETNHKMNKILKISMKKETEEDIKNYYKYHDFYIHEHNANMRAFQLLIDDAKSMKELEIVNDEYNKYINYIYKVSSPIEVMSKIKNIDINIDLEEQEKLMYGFPIKKLK